MEEYMKHIPGEITKDIDDYVTNEVLLKSRYIIYKTKGNKQSGYCTHCNKEFEIDYKLFRHNEKCSCPMCESKCIGKSEGISRGSLKDEATFIWYDKSVLDPEIVVAIGFYTVRNYSLSYRNVANEYVPLACYIFEKGKSTMLKRNMWYSSDDIKKVSRWQITKSIYSFNNNSLANYDYYCNYESIRRAVKGSCLKYSQWENYKSGDMLKYFELYNKYPNIEYLSKVGLGNLILTKLNGDFIGRTINWRGKDIYKMLKLSKKDFKEIIKANVAITTDYLELYQINCKYKDKQRLTPSELKDLEYITGRGIYKAAYIYCVKYSTPRKIYKYINAQFKNRKNNQFSSAGILLNDYKDYLEDCKKLDVDLSSESYLFPKDLIQAHENTSKQVTIKQNKDIDKKIKKRVQVLKKYYFEYGGLLIRPAASSIELIEEGKKQSICIGQYSERYANNKTDLFLIRRIDKPEEPFYAVEIKSDNIVQVRGKRNCGSTLEVDEFMKAFNEFKCNKKTNKKIA